MQSAGKQIGRLVGSPAIPASSLPGVFSSTHPSSPVPPISPIPPIPATCGCPLDCWQVGDLPLVALHLHLLLLLPEGEEDEALLPESVSAGRGQEWNGMI